MAGSRKVLVLTPQEKERGEPPDAEVDGFFGGVRFEKGVSEPISYTRALRFAGRGNVILPPEEADEYVEKVRGNGSIGVEEATAEHFDSVEVPEDYEAPGYQEMMSELNEHMSVSSIFGGFPKKGRLRALYYVWNEDKTDLLSE